MTALFFGHTDGNPTLPLPAKNTLLRMLDAAAESRLRAFHRAMSSGLSANSGDTDDEPDARCCGTH